MFRLEHPDPTSLPQDVTAFVDGLQRPESASADAARGLFAPDRPVHVARAPGRMDVMGGIADYSGSLVLQMPIREAAVAGVQREASGRRVRLVSLGAGPERSGAFDFDLGELEAGGRPLDYDTARALFGRRERDAWAAYLAGAFLVLMRERGAVFATGCRLLLDSKVPEGKGVSSSAAIEVATMTAVAAAYGIDLEPRELALLCQRVENRVVGAPCGVMDQMTSACGEANRLLALLCQPAQLLGQVELPAELAVWGLDSGIRHAVAGADYGSVRTGAFMGRRILERRAAEAGIDPGRWQGYLANVMPHELARLEAQLPERLSGAAFLEAWESIDDTVTDVDAGRDYAVRAPAAHPVHEHHRIRVFAELLATAPSPRRDALLGECMYQSHASYSACGLGSEGTDALVGTVEAAGPAAGLHGAKITGGGSGGTVAVLGAAGAVPALRDVARSYAAGHGHEPYLFTGSSPGAAAFGMLRLTPAT